MKMQRVFLLCNMLYYRRKILLALIEAFDGHLTAKQLQKYLFLLHGSKKKKAFDFIPLLLWFAFHFKQIRT